MVYTEINRTSSPKRRNHLLICLCVVLMAIVILSVTLGLTLGTSSSSSLKATFTNRCQTYLKDNGATTSQNDCEKIWESFKQAFVGRNPCDVPPDAYDSLLHRVSHDPACNRMLFWSKTKEIVHAFTEKRSCYLTLEDTLLGFTLDGLTWCGKNESQETFTTGCPGWSDCVNNPVRSFWNGASAAFAASACGDASVMLNGSIDMPFNPTSIFASVEVKHFNSSIMNGLTVLLVTKETDTKTCGSDASLKDLQSQLDPKLKYTCKIVPQSKIKNCISQPQIACGDCW
ncbi:ADP-ribosyl cyclase/cyclic ADP-ribose hydrolase 1-like [Alosa pseudoharengus]|uniref:ADP-ribosyl cyclase/cyclic ADP-ribose hydrolase 1-like n=1 Tax=Alosa pseudoharengus TaxID=34774 RepID=UPI003F894153